MTVWLLAALGIMPALLATLIGAGRGAVGTRLVAVQAATTLAIWLLVVLSFASDQASSIDLALSLALLSIPGTLVFALFQERWL